VTAIARDGGSVVEAPRHATSVAWTWRRFDALSGRDVYDLLALRSQVFVVEQSCPFLDTDYCDQRAWHLLGREVDAGTGALVAYLRALDPGVKYDEPSIGRVVVSEDRRSQGLGRVLMEEGMARARRLWPGDDIVIGAQHRLEAFYRSLGFVGEGEIYIEDGIDHVRMRLPARR
jgi:ElaA protein